MEDWMEHLQEVKAALPKLIGAKTMEAYLLNYGNNDIWQAYMDIISTHRVTDKAFNVGFNDAYTMGKADRLEVLELGLKLNVLKCSDKQGLKVYRALPDRVHIYRGCSADEKYLGSSWSICRGVAEFFAFRYGSQNRVVLEAMVGKQDIKAMLWERGEYEVLITDADTLEDVQVLATAPTEALGEYQKEIQQHNKMLW